MKTKVLYLITKATWGGAQRYVFDLATNVPKAEYEPVVAFGTPGMLSEKLAASGIELRRLPSLGRDIALVSDIKSFFEIWRTIRETRPEIIHLNSSKAAALGALAARLCGIKKIIFTVHGWPFKEARNAAWRSFVRAASWFTAMLSDEVIVVSKDDEARGRHMRAVGRKICYVPIGIQAPDFLARSDASRALAITTNRPRIVTIAELTPNKCISSAIDAIAMLKQQKFDVEYFVIGEGEERARLETLANERDVSERVHFLGFVPDAARYLKAFDVFFLSSQKEGMPYVLLEAAFAQLPIVSTSVVDPLFLALVQEELRVEPGDVRKFAKALTAAIRPAKDRSPRLLSTLTTMVEQTTALYLFEKP